MARLRLAELLSQGLPRVKAGKSGAGTREDTTLTVESSKIQKSRVTESSGGLTVGVSSATL